MHTETLTWYTPAERPPGDDRTLLVQTRNCAEPVWPGYTDGEHWYDTDNTPIEVELWAEMPVGGVAAAPVPKESKRG